MISGYTKSNMVCISCKKDVTHESHWVIGRRAALCKTCELSLKTHCRKCGKAFASESWCGLCIEMKSALQEDESVVAGGRDTHYHGDAPECDRAAKGVSGGLAGTQYLSDKSTPTSG